MFSAEFVDSKALIAVVVTLNLEPVLWQYRESSYSRALGYCDFRLFPSHNNMLRVHINLALGLNAIEVSES